VKAIPCCSLDPFIMLKTQSRFNARALLMMVVLSVVSCTVAFAPTSLVSDLFPMTMVRRSTNALSAPFADFIPSSTTLCMASSGFLGMDEEEDEDDEDDDEDDDDLAALPSKSGSTTRYSDTSFGGRKLDPWDPNPLIKPRPSKYFKNDPIIDKALKADSVEDDKKLVQTMTSSERQENLNIMRQIQKNDLPDLRRRKDHPGWVEANNDLKRRYAADPWFGVNERLRTAIQLGAEPKQIEYLKALSERLDGPPPGITINPNVGYAVHTEIYDIGITPSRAAAVLEREIRLERAARGRAMMAEAKKNLEKNQRQYEDDMRNPGDRRDREAKERRERTMRRLMSEIEVDNQKKRDRAKEILGKLPETPENRTKAMEKALKEAREEMKRIRRKELGSSKANASTDEDDDDNDDDDDAAASRRKLKSGADKAREALASEASGGRPRMPGDSDVTRGDVPADSIQSSSITRTGSVTVEVSSVYNKEQSDPPMRKHCFQYTIRITNNSPTDTIQLLGRRFEIQTVGSSMKDVVQGEGVTGRTPILPPGEVFEYTSTAPLSVRPIGTTIIAARMRGEYRYVTLKAGQSTASDAQVQAGGEEVAELGTFHFIFPEDQRVQPFRSTTVDDDDEEDDDDDDEDDVKPSKAVAKSASGSSTSFSASSSGTTPASTLPGDNDMETGDIGVPLNDSSEAVTDGVRVKVTSSYRPERSDAGLNKHCFAYNIRITNESKSRAIQLVSRRFEIQTVGSSQKDVVQGPGVTGRQPILQPGESFEYTSTAPLSVKPLLNKTPVVARMQGEYNFVQLGDDGTTPISSTPMKAKLDVFHFILPALV
jgi:ApaG protein